MLRVKAACYVSLQSTYIIVTMHINSWSRHAPARPASAPLPHVARTEVPRTRVAEAEAAVVGCNTRGFHEP